jgi:hypothetical protein
MALLQNRTKSGSTTILMSCATASSSSSDFISIMKMFPIPKAEASTINRRKSKSGKSRVLNNDAALGV